LDFQSSSLLFQFLYGSIALVRVDLHSVPVTFPLGADGFALVTSTMLSLRFQFRENALYVEEEVFDTESGFLLQNISQLPNRNNVGIF